MNRKWLAVVALSLMGSLPAAAHDTSKAERRTVAERVAPPAIDDQTTESITYQSDGVTRTELPKVAEQRKLVCQNPNSPTDTDCVVFRAEYGD